MYLVSLLLCKKESSFPVSLQLLRGGIWALYEVSLLDVGMETMLANFHMCGIMLVLRAAFNTETTSEHTLHTRPRRIQHTT